MAQLFGFTIGKPKEEEQKPTVQSFAPPPAEDGIMTVTEGGFYGTAIDQDGTTKNETNSCNTIPHYGATTRV